MVCLVKMLLQAINPEHKSLSVSYAFIYLEVWTTRQCKLIPGSCPQFSCMMASWRNHWVFPAKPLQQYHSLPAEEFSNWWKPLVSRWHWAHIQAKITDGHRAFYSCSTRIVNLTQGIQFQKHVSVSHSYIPVKQEGGHWAFFFAWVATPWHCLTEIILESKFPLIFVPLRHPLTALGL